MNNLKLEWYGWTDDESTHWVKVRVAGIVSVIEYYNGHALIMKSVLYKGYEQYDINNLLRQIRKYNSESNNIDDDAGYIKVIRYIANHPELLFDPLWDGTAS